MNARAVRRGSVPAALCTKLTRDAQSSAVAKRFCIPSRRSSRATSPTPTLLPSTAMPAMPSARAHALAPRAVYELHHIL
ncbi:hypothetical protein EVAR_66692_1 [Eumeta japonica]|uniref:Uncharacterized protein n=1 Tax=Eumeta variegata TaxID=151549 RepID=A0A4C1ZQ45_EUMVA|nr:hypothetical protein EVAR_66692_1 [Eumeta japonica]